MVRHAGGSTCFAHGVSCDLAFLAFWRIQLIYTTGTTRAARGNRNGFVFGVGMLLMPALVGCSSAVKVGAGPTAIAALQGTVRGGSEAIVGAAIQVYAAGETGSGSTAQPLLATAVTSDRTGGFAIDGALGCPSSNTQVYAVARGGSPASGGQENAGMAAMAMLGRCGDLTAGTRVVLNAATTAAATGAMAPFMTSATELGREADDASFAAAVAMVEASGDGGSPQLETAEDEMDRSKVNALANVLTPCMEASGDRLGGASACARLFALTTTKGAEAPSDSLEAALAIAKNPTANVTAIYGLHAATRTFLPTLTTAPGDWSLTGQTAAAMQQTGTMAAKTSGVRALAVSASTSGTTSATSRLSLQTSTVPIGVTSSGTLSIYPAVSTATAVTLTTSNAADVSVTSTITIPAGQTASSFSYASKAAGTATLTATIPNYPVASAAVYVVASAIPANFFGMTVQQATTVKPALSYGTVRSWDVSPGLAWADINTSAGVYDFTTLDQFLAMSQSRGADVIYTFGRTPLWASSKKATTGSYAPGQCAPATSMTDWDNFVTAIATHAKGRIKYWELWDEPNNPGTYCGDMPTLITMVQHAYQITKQIDPTATVLSPSSSSSGGPAWMSWFLNSGGGQYFDVLAIHGYWSTTAEDIQTVYGKYKPLLAAHGMSSKPMWDTETSWAGDGNLVTPVMAKQVSFIAKEFLLNWSVGFSRAGWYAYDGGSIWGGLWTAAGGATAAATSYQQTYRWMVGASLSTPCTMDSAGTWTCVLTRPNGYKAQAMWNSSTSVTISVPTTYVNYLDLAGGVHSFTQQQVTIADAPILLESGELPN